MLNAHVHDDGVAYRPRIKHNYCKTFIVNLNAFVYMDIITQNKIIRYFNNLSPIPATDFIIYV